MEAALVIEALNRSLGHQPLESETPHLHTDRGSTGPPPTGPF
jgi:hypothetical protein